VGAISAVIALANGLATGLVIALVIALATALAIVAVTTAADTISGTSGPGTAGTSGPGTAGTSGPGAGKDTATMQAPMSSAAWRLVDTFLTPPLALAKGRNREKAELPFRVICVHSQRLEIGSGYRR
jgi:hypothetical protein